MYSAGVRGRERFHESLYSLPWGWWLCWGPGSAVRSVVADRDAKVGHADRDPLELGRIELVEDAPDDAPLAGASTSSSIWRRPAVIRTRTTRRSLGTRIRSTNPRSSIRSTSPVAADSETSSISASRLIGSSPWRSSRCMTCNWVMLMPSRTSRSLPMHLSSPNGGSEVGQDGGLGRGCRGLGSAVGAMVRVT